MQKIALLLLGLVLTPDASGGGLVEIVSPDTFQTYSYSEARHRSLDWDETSRELIAYMTFSTRLYSSRNDPPKDEFCSFRFPGVAYNPRDRKYYATSREGRPVALAEQKEGLLTDWIEMLPGTAIFIFKKDGDVKLVLAATTDWREGDPELSECTKIGAPRCSLQKCTKIGAPRCGLQKCTKIGAPRCGLHWIERNEGWFLQNVIFPPR